MATNPEGAFMNCGSPMIFFEDSSIPKNWHSWKDDNSEVIFGYDNEDHTYAFSTEFGGSFDAITTKYNITLPTLANQGEYIFIGWYDNAEFSGEKLSGKYYSTENVTLYAKWMTEEELAAGTDMEHAYDLELDTPAHVVIDDSDERVYFKFTITETGTYYIYSYDVEGQKDDTLGYLYGESGNLIKEADYNYAGGYDHFGMEIELAPGTYYIATGYYISYGGGTLGDYMIVLSTVKPE